MNIGDRARPLESERFAQQLAEIGLNVAIVARRRPRLEELAHELETKNRVRVKIIAADLSQSDFLSLILSETQAIEIGLLVNNAGFGLARSFLDHELEKELPLLDVNCRVPLALSHVFGRQMAQRKRGGILPQAAILRLPMKAYAASKVYELFLAESLNNSWPLNRRQRGAQSSCPAYNALHAGAYLRRR